MIVSDAPPPLFSVAGESPLGEAAKAGLTRFASQRILGPWRWLPLSTFLAIVGATIAATGVIGAYGGSTDMLAAGSVAALFALFMGSAAAAWYVRRQTVRRWLQRGLVPVNTLSYAIDDEALTIAGTVSTTRLNWAGVSELAPVGRGIGGKGYWIMPAAGLVYYLPRRFFPTPQAETAFLAAMLARMTPQARARSGEARKLTAFE